MYHAETSPACKEIVTAALKSDDSVVKIIVCTSALECGVNMKNVRYVIHYGPAYDITDFCQQIGRAGRNTSNACHAVLYHYPNSLKNARLHKHKATSLLKVNVVHPIQRK